MPGGGLRIIDEALGGSPLSRAAQRGALPEAWYPRTPRSAEEWRARGDAARAGIGADWWERLAPACAPSGAAAERIARVVEEGGFVVTTGQQPGLFGGPLYTWVKALSALALADTLEDVTGLPVAPVFWAATDDSDFAEASWTMVASAGRAERLALAGAPPEGTRMADVPLGDVAPLLDALAAACGSAAEAGVLDVVRRSYVPGETVGSAYVRLLRSLLAPLGITVLDAAHEAVSTGAHPWLVRALERAGEVSGRLREREREIRAVGFEPQVADVPGRTLVFERAGGRRERLSHEAAARAMAGAAPGTLSANVLLRPVVERSLLPTAAYVAGPGEIAYFAQVSAVADALGAAPPLAVPRWSCTVVEPRIDALLRRYDLTPASFVDPHAVEARHARAAWPAGVARAFAEFRDSLQARAAAMRDAVAAADALLPSAVVDGVARSMEWQLRRFERRISAAVKRRESAVMHDLATLRAALYPGGVRQERALNAIPLLARYGTALLDAMREGAARHARTLGEGATVRAVAT